MKTTVAISDGIAFIATCLISVLSLQAMLCDQIDLNTPNGSSEWDDNAQWDETNDWLLELR